jgi:methylmalonyl-CoA/ethylmalonyl-CoA epimerase
MTADHHGLLVQVALGVQDLDRATAFYTETLGLPLIARYGALVFVDLGGPRLLLEPEAPASMIYLRVDNADASVRQLRDAGVEIVAEPHVIFTDHEGVFGPAGHAETQAFIRDSEGNLVGLVSHAAA